MAKFLNTDLLNEWIPRLIQETERELIIIVPYIKTPDRIYNYLLDANKRGVETTLIYRENKLSPLEKAKFEAIDNLNLMHHPNVHAKCYYNEKYLIICSMNLYEYSAKNNREMGVLLHKEVIDTYTLTSYADHDSIFKEAVDEIRSILNGAHIEKASRETREEGFEMEIIKTDKEREEEYCKLINKYFGHKKFEVEHIGNKWTSICRNYFDKVHVHIEHRAVLTLDFEESRLKEIFTRFVPHYHEYRFDGFKFYWNYHKENLYLYSDRKHPVWKDLSDEEHWQLNKRGIDDVISFMRQFI